MVNASTKTVTKLVESWPEIWAVTRQKIDGKWVEVKRERVR